MRAALACKRKWFPATGFWLLCESTLITTMSVYQFTTSLGALRVRAKAAQTTRCCASVTAASQALRVAPIQPRPQAISSEASSSTDTVVKWQATSGDLSSEAQGLVRSMMGDMYIATYLVGFALNMAAATAAAPLDELAAAHNERAAQLVTLATVLAESLQKRAATASTKAAWLLAKGDRHLMHLQEEHLPAMMAEIDTNKALSRSSEVAAAAGKAASLALMVPAVFFACSAAAAVYGMPAISKTIQDTIWIYNLSIVNGELRGRVVPSHDVPRLPAASSLLLNWSAIALPALLCLVMCYAVWKFLAGTVNSRVMEDADKRARELQLEYTRQSRALQRLADDDMHSLRAMLKALDPNPVGMHSNKDTSLLSTELCYLIADIRQALDDRGRLLADSAMTTQARLELNDQLLEVRGLLASSATRWSGTIGATAAGLVLAPFQMRVEDQEHDVTADLLASFLESNSQQLAERLDMSTAQVASELGYLMHSTCTPEQLLKVLKAKCRPGLAASESGDAGSAESE